MSRIKYKKPKYAVGDLVMNGANWSRKITQVVFNYLNTIGRIGYFYLDDFGYIGLCSEEHLTEWSKRYEKNA